MWGVIRQNLKMITRLGVAFFANAYNLLVIDFVMSILNELNSEDPVGMGMHPSSDSLLASAISVGAIIGMVTFGFIADVVGRRVAFMTTGALVMSGSIASSLCQRSESFPLVSQLVLFQVILGIGIGGEYPLSATIASECSDPMTRSRIVGGVFSMQGVGMIVSCLLPIIFISLGVPLETTWRLLLGLGAVPALIAFCLRVRIVPPSARQEQENIPASKRSSFWTNITGMKLVLFGCMTCWFLSDVTFYGTGRFKHAVQESVYGSVSNTSATDAIVNQAWFGLIIALIALPGYFLTVFFVPRLGLGRIQLWGFLAMAVAFAVFGVSVYENAPSGLQLFLFGLTFLFSNFGPNGAIFIIPSQIFPPGIRASCHGIAAAAGKLGSVVGGAGFPAALEAVGLSNVMYICTGVAFLGFLATFFLLPPVLIERLRLKYLGAPENAAEPSKSPLTDTSNQIES